MRLDLGLGEGLDGDDGEVVVVVSGCEMEKSLQTFSSIHLPIHSIRLYKDL